jgi:hypothetical protein
MPVGTTLVVPLDEALAAGWGPAGRSAEPAEEEGGDGPVEKSWLTISSMSPPRQSSKNCGHVDHRAGPEPRARAGRRVSVSSRGDAFEPPRETMNRVKVGYFSLSRRSTTGDDRPYLGWHQLDHMPEQYQLPGLVYGQRWASTPACRKARAAEVASWADVEHVVCYLMGDPVDETLDEFLALGRRLAEMGRFSYDLPSHYQAGLRVLDTLASPRALIGPEVVPYRPNRGIYLIVEEPTDRQAWDAYLRQAHAEVLPELVSVEGVAGAWVFSTTPAIQRPGFKEGDYRMTLCYLDDEPAEVGTRLEPVLHKAWFGAPSRPVLAGPFESMMRWDWDRFGPPPT